MMLVYVDNPHELKYVTNILLYSDTLKHIG